MVRARVAVAAPHAALIVMLSAFMANLSESLFMSVQS
jgi:hypothetical protein